MRCVYPQKPARGETACRVVSVTGHGQSNVSAHAKDQALADYPAAIFPAELMAAYPEAAVILTVRSDEQQWHESMMSTLIHAHLRREERSPMADKYHENCW